MATQYFGTWAPSNGFLPIITDTEIQFAAYYVVEPGSFNGVQYALGDWLIYIDGESEDNWYRSSGGIVSFNVSNSSMSPPPGTYTKLILGQNGNIVEASSLSASDVPAHKHQMSDVEQSSFNPAVYAAVKAILANSIGNLVEFKFDDKLKKVTADVKIDELSILKNQAGQLYAGGEFTDENGDPIDPPGSGSGSGSGTVISISIDKVTGLSQRLAAIESSIAQARVVSSAGSAVSVSPGPGGTTVDVRLDGVSIVKNADGEICINPALLSVYTIDGLTVTTNPDGTTTGSIGGTCGNATVDADKVVGLEDFVKQEILEYAKVFALEANDIPIDEDTIIVNSEGKLSAVFSKVTAHTHALKDVIDFPTERLQWASLQRIQADPDGVIDFTKGKFDISGLTVGATLEVYNQAFVDIERKVSDIGALSGKVLPGEPPKISVASLSLDSPTVRVWDTQSNSALDAVYGTIKTNVTPKFFPANSGTIQAVVDGTVVGELSLAGVNLGSSSGGMSVEKLEDYYQETPGFVGTYDGIAVSYSGSGFAEGLHSLKLRHVVGADSSETAPVSFHYLVPASPMAGPIAIATPPLDFAVSGVPAAKVNSGATVSTSSVGAVTARYAPLELGSLSYSDPGTGAPATKRLEYASTLLGEALVKPIEIAVPDDYSGSLSVTVTVKDAFGAVTDTRTAASNPMWFDKSWVESYRVVYGSDDADDYPPNDSTSPVLVAFDPSAPLNGADARYSKELQVIDDCAVWQPANYSQFGGPDYSVLGTTQCEGKSVRWITLLIPCDRLIFNGYFDVKMKSGAPIPKRLDGTLDGAFIWIAPVSSSTGLANNWLNANRPYDGLSAFSNQDKDYPGLDLNRSGKVRRWFTFGRRPENMSYDRVAVRVALAKGVSLDVAALINSMKESIDGQL